MTIATYVHLGERKALRCEKSEASKHPVVGCWLEERLAKVEWVAAGVLALSPVRMSSSKMFGQAVQIISACQLDKA